MPSSTTLHWSNLPDGSSCGRGAACKLGRCDDFRPSCNALKLAGYSATGVYDVDPDGLGQEGNAAFPVFCDMSSDGGGWTLVMRAKGGPTSNSGWLTADLLAACGNTDADCPSSFKFADEVINSFVSVGYRIASSGDYSFTRYWKPTCVYAHTSHDAAADCVISYSSLSWGDAKPGARMDGYWGVHDANGEGSLFIVSSRQGSGNWFLTGSGVHHEYGYSSSAEINFTMWVK
ncbi:MAG: hypothetical protein HY901_36815 [Deltaproteobacteria bacterium]|nr:hypothetical protein [Deltaproteobacteria bacterium]